MDTLRPAYRLMIRALRESIRQPWFEAPNIFIPFFFFAVSVGALGRISCQAFGVTNFTGYQMPVAILQAVAGTASNTSVAAVILPTGLMVASHKTPCSTHRSDFSIATYSVASSTGRLTAPPLEVRRELYRIDDHSPGNVPSPGERSCPT